MEWVMMDTWPLELIILEVCGELQLICAGTRVPALADIGDLHLHRRP